MKTIITIVAVLVLWMILPIGKILFFGALIAAGYFAYNKWLK